MRSSSFKRRSSSSRFCSGDKSRNASANSPIQQDSNSINSRAARIVIKKLFTVFTAGILLSLIHDAEAQGVRVVNNKLYGANSPLWKQIDGEYNSKSEKILLVQLYKTRIRRIASGGDGSVGLGSIDAEPIRYKVPDKLIAITNAPDYNSLASGAKVIEWAMQVGTVSFGGETYELWDCGTRYTPPPPTPEQLKAIQDAAKAKRAAADLAKKQQAEKSLKWNQDQAAAGDEYGQLRMGERYRDGDGVEKDLNRARTYFTLSAAQGNTTAKRALESLGKP